MPFANTNLVTQNGQQTKYPGCPLEIWDHGFTPPVRLPDGRIHAGDVLPASWFNDLISRLYEGYALSPSAATAASLPTADTSGSTAGGMVTYMGIHIGPITIEIGAWRATAASEVITLGTAVKAGTNPHLYLLDLSDPATTAGKYTLWAANGAANNKFQITAQPFTRGEASASPSLIYYIAVLENTVANSPNPLPGFCVNPRTFIDGQTSFAPPTQDQQLYGFAPARVENNVVVPGDTLPANVLNYLLNDLTGNFGTVAWEIKRNPRGDGMDSYCLNLGSVQITSQRQTIPGTPTSGNGVGIDTLFDFPFNPSVNSTPQLVGMLAGAVGVSKPAYAQAAPITSTVFRAACRDISAAANTAPGIANAGMCILAFGPAPDNKVRAWRKVAALQNGFAAQAKTYADGQLNKVSPLASSIENGFLPNRIYNGAATPGDLVTANELNFILNDLYAKAAAVPFEAGTLPANPATKRIAGGYIRFGRLLLQWEVMGTFTSADFSGNVRTHTFSKPYVSRAKQLPFVFVSENATHDNVTAPFTSNDAPNNRLTNAGVVVGGISIRNGAQAASIASYQMISFGEAP